MESMLISVNTYALNEEAVVCEQLGTTSGNSLIYERRKRDPRTVPWHSRRDIRLGGMHPLQQDLLRSVDQQ